MHRQKRTVQNVLAAKDRVLEMLTEDMVHLADHSFERQKSGTFNATIGSIRNLHRNDLRAQKKWQQC